MNTEGHELVYGGGNVNTVFLIFFLARRTCIFCRSSDLAVLLQSLYPSTPSSCVKLEARHFSQQEE